MQGSDHIRREIMEPAGRVGGKRFDHLFINFSVPYFCNYALLECMIETNAVTVCVDVRVAWCYDSISHVHFRNNKLSL